MNRDPDLEIVVSLRLWQPDVDLPRIKNYVLKKDASILPGWPVEQLNYALSFFSQLNNDAYNYHFSIPILADVRGDETPEIVQLLRKMPLSENKTEVFIWNADGSRVLDYPMTLPGYLHTSSVICLDFDQDGDPEIGAATILPSLNIGIQFWDLPEPSEKEGPWPMWGQTSRRTFRRTNPPAIDVGALTPAQPGLPADR